MRSRPAYSRYCASPVSADPHHLVGTRRWRNLRRWVLARDGGICHLCGLAGADSVDHLVARTHGGTNHLTNLAAAHLACNQRRGDKPLVAPVTSRAW